MKRLWIACALIFIAALFSVLEFYLVNNSYEKFSKELSEIQNYYSSKEFSKAEKSINKTKNSWKNREKTLKVFLLHGEVDTISGSLEELGDMIKQKDSKAVFYTCEKTKRQLLFLKKSELPYLENIM